MQITIFTTTLVTGILCGASLDQSIKQLPARHRIGIKPFSAYAKAADLKNGVVWYAILGIGSAVGSLLAAALVWKQNYESVYPIYLAALFAVAHTICTSLAAPLYMKQKHLDDEGALTRLFNKFERISAIRSVFITANFLCLLWSLLNSRVALR